MTPPAITKSCLLIPVLLWIVTTSVFSKGSETKDLLIYHSPEISAPEVLNEIESLGTISAIETEILSARSSQSIEKYARIRTLYQGGYAPEYYLNLAKLDADNARNHYQSEKNFRDLIKKLSSNLTIDNFIEGPVVNDQEQQEFQVRIPGLTLRSGGVDLFTVRMKAKPETTWLTKRYTAVRLIEDLAAPHKSIFQDYFSDHLNTLYTLPSSRETELERSRYYVSTIKHRQLLANHEFAKRWRQGQRIEQYSSHLADLTSGAIVEAPARTFAGSQESFWLFGDGQAVANPTANLSTSDIHYIERKAKSTHAESRAISELQTIQRRYDRLNELLREGVTNQAEIRETKLALDLAKLELEKAKAEQTVARKELEQILISTTLGDEFSNPVTIPNNSNNDSWLTWLKDRPTSHAHELLHFLELLKKRYQAGAAAVASRSKLNYEEERMAMYRKIPSVYRVELETQGDRVNIAQTDHANALENENLTVMQIQQWARRIERNSDSGNPHSPEILSRIMEAGKAVNQAKTDVAEIEVKQRKRKYEYDIDYLRRLRKVRQKGAANQYEIARAENKVLSSKGLLYTSLKDLAIVKQQAKFINVLYQSGSMNYDERGLEISRFMPEAGAELEKLAILKDSVDEGKILQYKAELADTNNRINELKRLIRTGHASPVEETRVSVKQKQIENRLAKEKARGKALKYSLALIKSLEFEPDAHQEIKPPEQIKL